MKMKTLKYYFKKAQKEKFAIGQFNFSDFTQMKAIVDAGCKIKIAGYFGNIGRGKQVFWIRRSCGFKRCFKKKNQDCRFF